MPTFLHRYPKTGMTVQGFIADDPSDANPDSYEPFKCVCFTGVHLDIPSCLNLMVIRQVGRVVI